jgi:hypothetical protein
MQWCLHWRRAGRMQTNFRMRTAHRANSYMLHQQRTASIMPPKGAKARKGTAGAVPLCPQQTAPGTAAGRAFAATAAAAAEPEQRAEGQRAEDLPRRSGSPRSFMGAVSSRFDLPAAADSRQGGPAPLFGLRQASFDLSIPALPPSILEADGADDGLQPVSPCSCFAGSCPEIFISCPRPAG